MIDDYIKALIGESWYNIIGKEFKKQYMINIGKFVRNERKRKIIYPDSPYGVFQVFRNVPYEKVKCVIVGQDPYPTGSYDGKAFSNKPDTPNMDVSPSLKNILKEVENDVYNGLMLDNSPDLTRWEKQGVMLINRILTVEHGKPGSHAGIGWQKFTCKVLNEISKKDNVIFMLWGNQAKLSKSCLSNNKNILVLESGHPSPLSANRGYWFGNKHFSKANTYLKEHNIEEIIW